MKRKKERPEKHVFSIRDGDRIEGEKHNLAADIFEASIRFKTKKGGGEKRQNRT